MLALASCLCSAWAVSGCSPQANQELHQDVQQTQKKLTVVQHESEEAAAELHQYDPQVKALQAKGRHEIAVIQKDVNLTPAEKQKDIAQADAATKKAEAALEHGWAEIKKSTETAVATAVPPKK